MRVKVSRESRDTFNRLFNELSNRSFENIDKKNEKGETILHHAARISNTRTVRLLVEKGADISAINDRGETPLHQAAFMRRTENVKVLIVMGADINATDNNRYVPLHLACLTGVRGTVKELIKAGADVNAVDKFGYSPLYYARNKTELVKLLEKSNGKIIDKSRDMMSGVENLCGGVIDVFDRLTLPKLKGKILNFNEVKRRDKSLIAKDWIKLRKKNVDLMNEITSLKKGLDDEKD